MSDTDNIIETVARAIAQADERNGAPPYDYRITLGKFAKEQLFDEAREAVQAIDNLRTQTSASSDEIEMLSRMWMKVDPNRQPSDPDEIITMHNPDREVPHWHWFIPRANGTLKFLEANGYKLVRING